MKSITTAFAQWAESKPHAGRYAGDGVVLNFYRTSANRVIHACPKCKRWFELDTPRPDTVDEIVCPVEKCKVKYTVKGGTFQWKPTSTPRS